MQVHDVQGSKFSKPDWCDENIDKTWLKCFYGETFNDPKKLRDKRVTVMNKRSEIYWAYRHKTNFRWIFLITDSPV